MRVCLSVFVCVAAGWLAWCCVTRTGFEGHKNTLQSLVANQSVCCFDYQFLDRSRSHHSVLSRKGKQLGDIVVYS
jgi:hypothetical protein